MSAARLRYIWWGLLLLGGAAVGLVVLFVLAMLGELGPPLSLEKSRNRIVVHVETLSEYPTTIRRARIEEADSGKVVFEVVEKPEFTHRGSGQIFNFLLNPGKNSVHVVRPGLDVYEVIRPRQGDSFVLRLGVKYQLRLWNGSFISSVTELRF